MKQKLRQSLSTLLALALIAGLATSLQVSPTAEGEIQGGATYVFRSAQNGDYLDATSTPVANGSAITLKPWDGSTNQQWTLTQLADGSYRVFSKAQPDQLLDIYEGWFQAGTHVGIWIVTDVSDAQRFFITYSEEKKAYNFWTYNRELVLGINDSDPA